MTDPRSFAAVDLGASSGRVVVGQVGADELVLEETHRFGNGAVRLPDGLHWDVVGLYREVLTGLRLAADHHPVSVGVDSWAVDYGLLDDDGALLGVPHHYRDRRTDGVAAETAERIGTERLYAVNGMQFLPFNTIFQLEAARGTPQLAAARTLLLIPDLIGYWLTGRTGAEVTNASTTGLLDVAARAWAPDLAAAVGLDPALLPELREPGSVIGALLPETARETGLTDVPVVAVASHDTASAVIGVPATTPDFAYISCGTWSLAGVELDAPRRTEAARRANFTNELGVDGTTRFLRNVMGLWLVSESMRAWGLGPSQLPALLAEAAAEPAFAAVVDPDDPRFMAPGDIPARIGDYCRETGQTPPTGRAAVLRCVMESLALAHRRAIRTAAALTGRDVDLVHIVGGGARNELLCQLTADALGLPVLAGPVEATAIGNILVQARAAGLVGDLPAMRALTAATQGLRRYEPKGPAAPWTAAAARLGWEDC
ncbi:rhamnulokinase [Actinorugispora endophytica]|uniref:Rhamnulokinase n=1 Tax=Actinorugispora endophytica TaxID=1605990 RepID=A0A4R6UXU2_9ACTN|nr:rhamnulokinase family protein [Actinorugispora endophytica]TDQ50753.1 rhamnulokinase [Actinorugispora endophytica]